MKYGEQIVRNIDRLVETMNNVMFIVNPVSGHGRTRSRWKEIASALQGRGLQFGVEHTEAPLHAIELTRQAINNEYNCIVAVGGDGTLNEVLNGFFQDGRLLRPDVMLSALSTGTGSDVARVFNFPGLALGLDRLWNESCAKSCDIVEATFYGEDGIKQNRWLLNIADVGLGSETCLRVNRNSKYLGGFASFLTGALSSIIHYRNQPLSVEIDGQEVFNGPSALVAVANGRFFGGGMMIAPGARTDDGLLDVVVLKEFTRLELLCNMPRVYRGRHVTHPKVMLHQGQNVTIRSPNELALEMEGEVPGKVCQASFAVRPLALKIVG